MLFTSYIHNTPSRVVFRPVLAMFLVGSNPLDAMLAQSVDATRQNTQGTCWDSQGGDGSGSGRH